MIMVPHPELMCILTMRVHVIDWKNLIEFWPDSLNCSKSVHRIHLVLKTLELINGLPIVIFFNKNSLPCMRVTA